MHPEQDDDWIERVTRLAAAVGMNPVRVRWKLRAWRERTEQRKRRAATQAKAITRRHKICPACNGINGADEKTCIHCDAKLSSRPVELIRRVFRHMDLGLHSETLLVGAFLAVYALVAFKGQESNLLSLSVLDLARFGANIHDPEHLMEAWQVGGLMSTMNGQWWRLLTSVFLHAGAMHIAFNIWALLYIAPFCRQVFGADRTLVTFTLAGIFASLASLTWAVLNQQMVVSIGASGAVCGLIGAVVAWGHLQGTWQGLQVRNGMLRWVAYIFIFGFLFNTDHAAHIGGLVAGGLMGWAMPAERRTSRLWSIAGTLAGVACLATVAWIAWLGLGR